MTTVATGDSTGPYMASLEGKCDDGTAKVAVFINSVTEEETTYNACWLTLAYDTNALEFTEAVGREQHLLACLIAHQHLRPVYHRGGDELQRMAAQ